MDRHYIVDDFIQRPALLISFAHSSCSLAMDKLDKGLVKIIRNKAAGTVVIFERNVGFFNTYFDFDIFEIWVDSETWFE